MVWNNESKPGYQLRKIGNETPAKHAAAEIPGDVQGDEADGTCCNQHAADMMLKKLDEVDYILVGWEHANINYLAASLAKMEYEHFKKNVSKVNWHGSDFDRIYEMHFTPDGDGSYKYVDDTNWDTKDKVNFYDKRQDFDYPERANYTSPDGTPLAPNGTVDDSEVLHKAYLGPQAPGRLGWLWPGL